MADEHLEGALIPSASLTPDPDVAASTGGALDALFEDATKAAAGNAPAGDKPAGDAPAGDAPAGDAPAGDAPAGDKPAGDAPAGDAPAGDKPAGDAPAGDAPAGDKPAGDAPAGDKPVDEFENVELPPHTKPKTGEAFGKVKELARAAVAAERKLKAELETKLTALQKERDELLGRPQVDPKIQTELEDLRKFKLSYDVESDPTFQKFDADLKTNEAAILKRLADAGMSAEQIENIKKIGGVDALDWEPIFPKLPLALRSFVQAKLVENVTLRDKRTEALDAAKKNADAFMQERQTRSATELANHVVRFAGEVPWLKQVQIPPTATAEEKARLENHNKLAGEFRQQLTKMTSGPLSAERFAEYAVCSLFATKFQRELGDVSKNLAAVQQTLTAVTAERDKYKALVEAARKAEGGRSASAPAGVPPKKPASVTESADSALDRLKAELTQQD